MVPSKNNVYLGIRGLEAPYTPPSVISDRSFGGWLMRPAVDNLLLDLQEFKADTKDKKLVGKLKELSHHILSYFANPHYKTSESDLYLMWEEIKRINRPLTTYAFAMAMADRAYFGFGPFQMKNQYARLLENMDAPDLKDFIKKATETLKDDNIKALKDELEAIHQWAVLNPELFGKNHQTELTKMMQELADAPRNKKFFTPLSYVIELGNQLSDWTNKDKQPEVFKRLVKLFTREITT